MTGDRFDPARKVADAVLYEGYLLYPYRASAGKNRLRWQFGVLVPPAWAEADGSEPPANQTECLVEAKPTATVQVRLRFLRLRTRHDQDGGWDEGVEQEIDVALPLADLLASEREAPFQLAGGSSHAARRDGPPWTEEPVSGVIRSTAERLDGPYGVIRLRLRVENTSTWSPDPAAGREDALRRSLIGTHVLFGLDSGAFISLLDPPEWAQPAATACQNLHVWPMLVGEPGRRDLMLSAPIILYDYPAIAPESPGELFDGTEIDEILTLRTMALTDEEKSEARATDERAAAIMDRVDTMPAELLDRLHGAVRYLREATTTSPGAAASPGADWPPGAAASPEAAASPGADWPPGGVATPGQAPASGRAAALAQGVPAESDLPWWDPGADASVSPETDSIQIGGVAVAKGTQVRLRPGHRRADAQDMFLQGRTATVAAVFHDVDGNQHLGVTLDDDPAAELQQWHGRYIYFAPDEIEPL